MKTSLFKGRIVKDSAGEKYGFVELKKHHADHNGSLNSAEKTVNDTDAIEKEAYGEGYKAGEEAGLAMGQQKVELLIERIEKTLKELIELRERTLSDIEPKIIELSMVIAKKILIQDIESNQEKIVDMIKRALEKIQRFGTITIKIHPSVRDVIYKHKPSLLNIHSEIVFDIDPSIDPHGPVVVSPIEEVSLDIDSQLLNIMEDVGERITRDQS